MKFLIYLLLAENQAGQKERKASCKRYDLGLKDLSWIDIPNLTYKDICPFLYTIRVKEGKRDELRVHLRNFNVDTGIHWPPGHKFKFFNKSKCSPLILVLIN